LLGDAFSAMNSSWLHFVFEEALVGFGGQAFRQIWGIPMGTALSRDAANTCMALCEDVQGIYNHTALSACLPHPECLVVFARLVDDFTIVLITSHHHYIIVLAGVDDEVTTCFLRVLQARVAPHLRIVWKVSRHCMDTLYLHVFVGDRVRRIGLLDYRTHQKLGNRYTYLPFASTHPVWTQEAIVKAQVMRRATNCSSVPWFRHMVNLYGIRQLYQGFPPDSLLEWVSWFPT
jgi:hypothetical protein